MKEDERSFFCLHRFRQRSVEVARGIRVIGVIGVIGLHSRDANVHEGGSFAVARSVPKERIGSLDANRADDANRFVSSARCSQ